MGIEEKQEQWKTLFQETVRDAVLALVAEGQLPADRAAEELTAAGIAISPRELQSMLTIDSSAQDSIAGANSEDALRKFGVTMEQLMGQRIIDDSLVKSFFFPGSEQAKKALQTILRTLLSDPDFVVDRFAVEYPMVNVGHRGIRIDVWSHGGERKQIALEFQKATKEGSRDEDWKIIYPRAVFEAATMVTHSLATGETYRNLEKVIVIYFLDYDIEGGGQAIYRHEMTEDGKADEFTEIAPTILFVNGAYKDNATDIGRLIADVMEPDPDKMRTPELKARMSMLKETTEGRELMLTDLDKRMEEYAKEYAKEHAKEYAVEYAKEYAKKSNMESNLRLIMDLVREGSLAAEAGAKRLDMTTDQLLDHMARVNSN